MWTKKTAFIVGALWSFLCSRHPSGTADAFMTNRMKAIGVRIPIHRSLPPVTNRYLMLPSTGVSPESSTMALSLFGDFIPSDPDPDLLEDNEDGREAEIGWKVRYATLALLLTSLTAGEVLFFPDRGSVAILRDSYLLWAVFYTEATRKIRWEAKNHILKVKNRFGIQLWHSIVVIILWADVSASPTATFIIDFLKDVFT
ncbi:hypothetical protein MHU86_21918 [Fragilaria crotonensis]|nr:hypothetical protein MHU86_21918 [Fragilaria crotonensis]